RAWTCYLLATVAAPARTIPGSPSASAPAAVPKTNPTGAACANPNALGVSRVVEVDTKGGPGFGFEHFKSHDFLREGEVVLTFDDGPWPRNTQAVLAALTAHCTKAIFFPIGLHATYEPGLLKQVAAAGHAIGSHTWCHQDLSKTSGKCRANGRLEKGRIRSKGRDREGHQRGAMGRGRTGSAVFSVSRLAPASGAPRLSGAAKYRGLFHRLGFLRLQAAQAGKGSRVRIGQAEEAGQRHH